MRERNVFKRRCSTWSRSSKFADWDKRKVLRRLRKSSENRVRATMSTTDQQIPSGAVRWGRPSWRSLGFATE